MSKTLHDTPSTSSSNFASSISAVKQSWELGWELDWLILGDCKKLINDKFDFQSDRSVDRFDRSVIFGHKV